MTRPDTPARELADLHPPAPIDNPAFGVDDEVYEHAGRMYLEVWTDEDGIDRAHCPRCDRGIIDLRYLFAPDERTGLVIAHMIQTHGWTRESTGE